MAFSFERTEQNGKAAEVLLGSCSTICSKAFTSADTKRLKCRCSNKDHHFSENSKANISKWNRRRFIQLKKYSSRRKNMLSCPDRAFITTFSCARIKKYQCKRFPYLLHFFHPLLYASHTDQFVKDTGIIKAVQATP